MKTYVHEQHESKVSCQTSSAMCSKAHLLCGPGESFHYKRVGSLEDLTLCDNWRLGGISDATLCIFFSFYEQSLTVASFTSNQLLCFWKGAAPTCGLPATRLRSKTKPPSRETERLAANMQNEHARHAWLHSHCVTANTNSSGHGYRLLHIHTTIK